LQAKLNYSIFQEISCELAGRKRTSTITAKVCHQNCIENKSNIKINTFVNVAVSNIFKAIFKIHCISESLLLTLNCNAFKRTHYLGTEKIFFNVSTSSNTFLLDFLLN